MSGHGEKWSRRQEAALVALLSHGTIAEAAAACGLSEKTLRRWVREPSFAAEFRARRRELIDGAVKVLQAAGQKAVATLVENLDAVRPADAIRAASAVLDWTFKGVELLDLAEEVAALKATVAEMTKGKP